jgi:hypothetical protein
MSKLWPRVKDWEIFWKWIMADKTGDRRRFLLRGTNSKAVRELFREKGTLPKGVDAFAKPSLSYRRKT